MLNPRNGRVPARGVSPALVFLTSPGVILAIIWSIAIFIYAISAGFGDSMLYFRFMVQAERIKNDATVVSFIWLAMAFAAFCSGSLFVRKRLISTDRVSPISEVRRARSVVIVVFGVTALVAFLWVGLAILQLGGLGRMAALATSENARAREVLLSAAFPGGRLISTGFIGLSVFCAGFLALRRERPLSFTETWPFYAILAASMAYLAVIPIIMSGRVNFFSAVIASYIAVCISNGKLVGLKFLPIPIVALSLVWGVTDYYAMGHVIQVSPMEQATQGILFYFYNDVSNALNPIGKLDGYYGYGWNSLRFVFFMTFTDDKFLSATRESLTFAEQFRPGGEFPFLTAPYADFGLFGLLILMIFGGICFSSYRKALEDNIYAPVYSLIFAGLVLSIHSSYVTNQEIVYNIILILLMIKFCHKGTVVKSFTRSRA